jgi:hypothetical protein
MKIKQQKNFLLLLNVVQKVEFVLFFHIEFILFFNRTSTSTKRN